MTCTFKLQMFHKIYQSSGKNTYFLPDDHEIYHETVCSLRIRVILINFYLSFSYNIIIVITIIVVQ